MCLTTSGHITYLLLVLCPWLLSVDMTIAGPIVSTKYGKVEGSRRIFNGQVYEEYLGIPFAEPPVGNLRWRKPQPVQPWDHVLNATEYSMHCTQFLSLLYPLIGISEQHGEDCLYLNVWVPRGVDANQGRKLPVMAFIYGGGYMIGTGEMYPGNGLAVRGDVVVVNFNYRVNVFGFMSTGDSAASGNYGLWDVEAALVWIQENIAEFAGDPTKVTIFGQSAGGDSVSHAVISPKTRGLFTGAIAISGGATNNIGIDYNAPQKVAALADIFNCDGETSDEIVDCLRAVDPNELWFWSMVSGASTYLPVIDGDFVPLRPSDAFLLGYGRNVNFITGYAYDDSAGFIIGNPIALPILGDRLNMAANNNSVYEMLYMMVGGKDAPNADQLVAEIVELYPGLNTVDVETRTIATTRCMTDESFGAPGHWEATVQSTQPGNSGSTYMYQFRHRFSFLVGYPNWVNGSHLDDIYGVLAEPFMQFYRRLYLKHDYDDVDTQVMQNIIAYYSNFAYTGNPNEGPNPVPVEWTAFDPALQNYLLEAPTFTMEEFDQETVNKFRFWDEMANLPPVPLQFTAVFKDAVQPDSAPDYFFVDFKNRYILTESDIEIAVDNFRKGLQRIFIGNDEQLVAVETMIKKMVSTRVQRLALQSGAARGHKRS